jgi:DNA-binding response OmpR family regulator
VLDISSKTVIVNGTEVRLTAREYHITELLIRNAGRVFSAEEIYEKVWDDKNCFAVENTVMVHIRRIREKIEVNTKNPRYLKVVWRIGYKIEKIKN